MTPLRVLVESWLPSMVGRPSGGGADAGDGGGDGHHNLARDSEEKEALTGEMKLTEENVPTRV